MRIIAEGLLFPEGPVALADGSVLLSDCRSTVDGDPVAAAGALTELVVVAPESDSDEARAFAHQVGARCITISGPSQVASALTQALDRAG